MNNICNRIKYVILWIQVINSKYYFKNLVIEGSRTNVDNFKKVPRNFFSKIVIYTEIVLFLKHLKLYKLNNKKDFILLQTPLFHQWFGMLHRFKHPCYFIIHIFCWWLLQMLFKKVLLPNFKLCFCCFVSIWQFLLKTTDQVWADISRWLIVVVLIKSMVFIKLLHCINHTKNKIKTLSCFWCELVWQVMWDVAFLRF